MKKIIINAWAVTPRYKTDNHQKIFAHQGKQLLSNEYREKCTKNTTEQTKDRYKVPISLWFVEKSQRFIKFKALNFIRRWLLKNRQK